MKIPLSLFFRARQHEQFTTPSARLSVAILLALQVYGANAQLIGQRVGPQFPFLTSTARVAALGDAGSALVDDFSGFASNPGILGLIKQSVIDYSLQRIQKGITFEHLGIAYKTTTLDALAFSLDVLHFGGTDFYTNTEVRNLGFEMRTGLAYGRSLSEAFSMGINLQALMTTTGPNSVWAFVGDIGFAYVPGKYIRYGFFLKGLGSDYNVSSSLLQTDVFTGRIARVFGVGLTIDFPFSDRTKKILVTAQNEKVIGETGLIYKLGVEYFPFWSTSFKGCVRGGFVARESNLEPRFGLGVALSMLSLDYAYGYVKRFSQPSQMITVSFAWPQ